VIAIHAVWTRKQYQFVIYTLLTLPNKTSLLACTLLKYRTAQMEKNTSTRPPPSYGRGKILLLFLAIAAGFNLYHGYYTGQIEQVIKASPASNRSQELKYDEDFDWSQVGTVLTCIVFVIDAQLSLCL
jgi:hypothetical protein